MGRDKVLGLSLAILLIGFAGAFCFRNEPIVESGLKVARAKILDDVIAQRSGPKPYVSDTKPNLSQTASPSVTLQGIQSIEPDPANQTAQAAAAEKTAKSLDAASVSIALDDSPSTLTSNDPFKSESPAANSTASDNETKPPTAEISIRSEPQPVVQLGPVQADPIQANPAPVIQPPDRIPRPDVPARSVAWRPIAAEQTREVQNVKPAVNGVRASTMTVYHVRRGDSLIRLAQRYLGDGRRFREIYDANQDQLHSPDAPLRIGMALKIPNSSSKPIRISGPTASTKHTTNHTTRVASRTSRTHRVPVQNVSRVRETAPPKSGKRPPAATKENGTRENGEKASPLPKDRFIPVRRAPFLLRSSQSKASDGPASDLLSQRPSKHSDKFWPAQSFSGLQYEFFPKGETPKIVGDSEEMNGP